MKPTTLSQDIYPNTIKSYKIKRLFHSPYFRSLYSQADSFTLQQYEYKLATHCWLQRLCESDIITIMAWWYKKHGIQANFWHLRHVIIPETYRHTKATVKAQRHAEYERAKARRAEVQA